MIENLKFFQDREALAGPDGFQLGHRHEDRTVGVVRRYLEVSTALKANRLATMETLTAKLGESGAVVLEVADKERFASLQEAIAGHEEQIKALEDAICKLDEIASGCELWYEELEYTVGGLGNTEGHERRRLANLASVVLTRQMNSGKSTEEILAEDEEYQRISKIAEEQIANANKQLETLRPKLAEMKAILVSVGC